jgi:hypothetical protein
LNLVVALTNNHGAVDSLAPSKKLALGHNGTAAALIATIAATLLLGLESCRPLHALRLGDELGLARDPHLDDGVRVVRNRSVITGTTASTPTSRCALPRLVVVVKAVIESIVEAIAPKARLGLR